MRLNKLSAILPLLLAAFLSAFMMSCSKEDEETTKLYMDGDMTVGRYPYYIAPGETVTFHPGGITHPDGNALGLYYVATDDYFSLRDTIYNASTNPMPAKRVAVDVTYPDSLTTYSVTFTIYPIDSDTYYSSSVATMVTVVSEDSVPQIKVDPDEPSFFDDGPDRGNEEYNLCYLGGKYWMMQNLRYAGLGTPYDHCEAMRKVFGNFYTWEEAIKACPDGWRLPTDADWAIMANYVNPGKNYQAGKPFVDIAGKLMADAYFNGVKMWEFWPAVKITNVSGLGMAPIGYYNSATIDDFLGANNYACFWTADTNPESPSQALYRYIYVKDNILKLGSADKNTTAMSVRCIMD